MASVPFSSLPYIPQHGAWPYTTADFARSDPSPDTVFYKPARLVTHIDDHAIDTLRKYYESALPPRGRILDLCSSWISHLPKTLEDQAAKGELEVIGAGMNAAELAQNSILVRRIVQDLNVEPSLPGTSGRSTARRASSRSTTSHARSRFSARCAPHFAPARRSTSSCQTGASRRRRSRAGCASARRTACRWSATTSGSQAFATSRSSRCAMGGTSADIALIRSGSSPDASRRTRMLAASDAERTYKSVLVRGAGETYSGISHDAHLLSSTRLPHMVALSSKLETMWWPVLSLLA
jgi:hypothetical protein